MTRTEIDELIEYLEKTYYVECRYRVLKDEFGEVGTLMVSPFIRLSFSKDKIDKNFITNQLDALDLIRF
jgi:hypothetical protein